MKVEEFSAWESGKILVNLDDEFYLTREQADGYFKEILNERHREELDDSDYVLNDFLEEYCLFNRWDLDYNFGSKDWNYSVVELPNDDHIVLVIAVKE